MRGLLYDQEQQATTRVCCVREADQRFGLEQFETEWQKIYSMACSKA